MLFIWFLVVAAVDIGKPIQSLPNAQCRYGTSAEFSAAPSTLQLCLGEGNGPAIASQALDGQLGGANSFKNAGVFFVFSMLPPEMFALALPDSRDGVLAIIEARAPVSDSLVGAQWLAQKAPPADTAWSNCASDGLGEWQVCRQRYLPFSVGHRLIETVRLIGGPRLTTDSTARFYVVRSKCLILEVDC